MKLSLELIDKYSKEIERGNSFQGACNACGISVMSRHRWRERAELLFNLSNEDDPKPEGNYDKLCLEFYLKDNEAQGKVEARMVARVHKAADDGTWQAAAWFLERRYPDRYGKHGIRLRELDDINPEALPVQTPERREEARRVVKDFLEKNKK